jgi:hypothetical protein
MLLVLSLMLSFVVFVMVLFMLFVMMHFCDSAIAFHTIKTQAEV